MHHHYPPHPEAHEAGPGIAGLLSPLLGPLRTGHVMPTLGKRPPRPLRNPRARITATQPRASRFLALPPGLFLLPSGAPLPLRAPWSRGPFSLAHFLFSLFFLVTRKLACARFQERTTPDSWLRGGPACALTGRSAGAGRRGCVGNRRKSTANSIRQEYGRKEETEGKGGQARELDRFRNGPLATAKWPAPGSALTERQN
jgi:hypothetical protein